MSEHGGYVLSNRNDGNCIAEANMDRDPKTGMYVDYASNVVWKKGKLLKYLVI